MNSLSENLTQQPVIDIQKKQPNDASSLSAIIPEDVQDSKILIRVDKNELLNQTEETQIDKSIDYKNITTRNGSNISIPSDWYFVEDGGSNLGGYVTNINQEKEWGTLLDGEVTMTISSGPHDPSPELLRNNDVSAIINEAAEQWAKRHYDHCQRIDKKTEQECSYLEDVCNITELSTHEKGFLYKSVTCKFEDDGITEYTKAYINERATFGVSMKSKDVTLIDRDIANRLLEDKITQMPNF